MVSLTPMERSAEVTGDAMREGLTNGGIVLTGMLGAMYAALKNPKFRRITNAQSRTAMVIMPALFAFGFTAENRLVHKQRQMALENEHAIQSVQWAEGEKRRLGKDDSELATMYRHSILTSHHMRIVPELQTHHKALNYVQENPFKIILAVGLPSVAYIFNSQSGNTIQMKILHTRVIGQFAVICTLLGVSGMKGLMDEWGRYTTEEEVTARVQSMIDTRHRMMDRIDEQKQDLEQRTHVGVKMNTGNNASSLEHKA